MLKLGIQLPQGTAALYQEFTAGLTAGGKVSGSYNVFNAGLTADANANITFGSYFTVQEDRLTIEALYDFISQSNFKPWDLEAVSVALQDNQTNGFSALYLSTEGEFAFGLDAGLGYSLNTSKPIGDTPTTVISASVDSGATITHSQSKRGGIDMTVYKKGNDVNLAVTLTSSSAKGTEGTLDIGGTITGLDEVAQKYLTELNTLDAPLLATLDKYTDLDGLIKSKIVAIDDSVLQQLANVAYGQSSASTFLNELVINEVTGQLDALVLDLGNDADALAEKAVINTLEVFSISNSKFQAALTNVIKVQLTGIKTEIDGKLIAFKNELSQELNQLDSYTSKLSNEIQAAVSSADASLQPIRDVLEKYKRIKAQLTEALEEAANIKFALSCSAAKRRNNSKTDNITVTFTDPSAAKAKLLYETLITGQVNTARRLFKDIKSLTANGIKVKANDRSIILAHEKTTNFSFNVLNELDNHSEVDLNTLSFAVDETGTIIVNNTFTAMSKDKMFKELREGNVAFNYYVATGTPTTVKGSIDLSLRYTDNNTHESGEIRQYLDSLNSREYWDHQGIGHNIFFTEKELENTLITYETLRNSGLYKRSVVSVLLSPDYEPFDHISKLKEPASLDIALVLALLAQRHENSFLKRMSLLEDLKTKDSTDTYFEALENVFSEGVKFDSLFNKTMTLANKKNYIAVREAPSKQKYQFELRYFNSLKFAYEKVQAIKGLPDAVENALKAITAANMDDTQRVAAINTGNAAFRKHLGDWVEVGVSWWDALVDDNRINGNITAFMLLIETVVNGQNPPGDFYQATITLYPKDESQQRKLLLV